MTDGLAQKVLANLQYARRPSCPLVTRGTLGGLGLTPAVGGEQRQVEFCRTGATGGITTSPAKESS